MGIVVTLMLFLLLVFPLGDYLFRVGTGKKVFGDRFFGPVERTVYRVCGIDERTNMSWKQYVLTMVLLNGVVIFVGYFILRAQGLFMGNPNGIGNMSPSLAFNTVISFMTNTDLQHYSGETGLSYLSQISVILFMMFLSAASGYSVCVAFVRGIVGTGDSGMGNFYCDLTRVIIRILLPLSFIVSILLVWQGVPQNFSGNLMANAIEGGVQKIGMGPVAAFEAIKHIGTNGGGFFGANSASPFENPTIITNIIEIVSMMLLPGSCVVMFGKMVLDRNKKQEKAYSFIGKEGRTIFIAMGVIFLIGLTALVFAERSGNPILQNMGIAQSMGNMEGKELRFGSDMSAFFSAVTTSFTTGSVNNMHDSLSPLGGMVALINMMLNVVFGGKGVGLMNMTIYVILTVFICSLMIGRTPEYLGKKIEGKEMKLVAMAIIIHPLLILGFSAIAVSTSYGISAITNSGPHGLTQILYEFTSAAANNGSGFEGLKDNTYFWNITTGIVMFLARYIGIIIQMAIAGSLMKKNLINETVGTLKTNNLVFSIVLVMIVYIFAGLTFFPALSLGPVTEHLMLFK